METIGLFQGVILSEVITGYLMRGGIGTPNILSLIPFIFAIPFGIKIIKKRTQIF